MVHCTQFTKTPYSIRPPRKWLNIDFTHKHVWAAHIGCLRQTKWEASPWNTGMSVLACGHRWITNASAALRVVHPHLNLEQVYEWDHVDYSRNISGDEVCFPTASIPAYMLLPRLPVMLCYKGKVMFEGHRGSMEANYLISADVLLINIHLVTGTNFLLTTRSSFKCSLCS